MKKILGIHGYGGNPKTNDFWPSMRYNLEKNGINLITPTFPESRITNYGEWKDVLDKQDFSEINKVIGHSLGTRVTTEYIIQNNIKLDKLVLVSPTITANRANGTSRDELTNFFPDYEIGNLDSRFQKLKELVKEIIVIASLDDTAVPFSESKEFAEIIGARFIETDGNGHFNEPEYKELEELIK